MDQSFVLVYLSRRGAGGQDSTATAVIIGPRWLAVGSFKKRSVERREKEKKKKKNTEEKETKMR